MRRTLPAAAFLGLLLLPSWAPAQTTELAYDDGRPAGRLDVSPGDIEVVRFTPRHPARVENIRLFFWESGCTASVRIWPDNGGNAPDLDHPLFAADETVAASGWLEIHVPPDQVILDPPKHFYVGHEAGDPPCRLAWDASGSEEVRSLARLDGSWYFIGDGSDPPKALDALVRATVEYFAVVETPWFREVTQAAGLPSDMRRLAWADYDGDGLEDLLVSGRRLFRNNGDGTFTEVTEEAGIGDVPANGGVWADYDNDGWPDFYATVSSYHKACTRDEDCVYCTLRTNEQGAYVCDAEQRDWRCLEGRCTPPSGELAHDVLWHNEGDGTFSDVSEEAGRPYDYLPTEAAAWADYDGDGYVDLYVANYEVPAAWTRGALGVGTPDFLWRNEGDGTFSDVSEEAGIRALPEQCGRGVAWADWDQDGDPDIYVANYRLNFNFLWENLGDGTFWNVSGEKGVAGQLQSGAWGHSIGAAWADLDRDGDWDLFVANLAHPRFIEFSDKSMLYLNAGPPDFSFQDAREEYGITYCETHSEPAWGDLDNDGWEDLFITAVYVGYQAFVYRNESGARFVDVTYPSGIVVDNGWGATWVDYDRDGRLDLATRTLWHNEHPQPGHWLEVRLEGRTSNRLAIGAQVEIQVGTTRLRRQVVGGKGTGNQPPQTLHFGLGPADRVDRLSISWPSGLHEDYHDIPADQLVTFVEGATLQPDGGGPDGGPGDAAPPEQDADEGPPPGPSGGCGCSATPTSAASYPHSSAWPLSTLLVWLLSALLLRLLSALLVLQGQSYRNSSHSSRPKLQSSSPVLPVPPPPPPAPDTHSDPASP